MIEDFLNPAFQVVGQFFIFFVITWGIFGFLGDLTVEWQRRLFLVIVFFLMIVFGTIAVATALSGLQ